MRFRKEAFIVVASTVMALALVFSLNFAFVHRTNDQFHYRYKVGGGMTIAQEIKAYEKRTAEHPNNGLELAILADLYFDQGRRTGDTAQYDRAEQVAVLSLKALPSPNLSAKGILAKVAASRHRFAESIRIGEEMLKENAGSEGGMAVLATAYLAIGDSERAAEYADRLALAKPLMSNLALRGLVLLAQGREDEGVFEFKHALAMEEAGQSNESSWTRAILGRHLFKRGKWEAARQLFEEANRITPEFPLALDLLGQLEVKQRRFTKAESYFNEAFAVSRQIPYLLHLADVTALKGQLGAADALRAQAEDLIRKELASGAYGHRLDLARVLIDRGFPVTAAEAVKLVERETEVRRNADTYYTLSLALGRAKRWVDARAAIANALRVGGREPEYYYQAALAEQHAGSRERAAFYSDQVRRQDPSFEPPKELVTRESTAR